MSKSSSNPVYEAPGTSDVRHVVAWLSAAQWCTSFALWAVLAVGWVLPGLDYPLRTIAPLGLAAAICRTLVLIQRSRSRSVPSWLAGGSLAADAALLTGLLDITGGPFNPFIVLYVVCIWLAVVALSPAWAAPVAAVAAAGFGWLVIDHLRAGLLEHHRLNDLPTHLFTMWFTGTAVAELVTHYVVRAHDALAQRQHLLEEARDQAARSDRLAALTTLAAGAAHELSTPLGTIAVASRELERSAARLAETSGVADAIKDDARLIRTEVDRCQVILDGMSGRASDGLPLVPVALSADALVRLAQNRLVEDRRRRLRVELTSGAALVGAAQAGVVQAVSSLLKNAFDASSASDEVMLRVLQRGSMLRFEVQDRGAGMSDEVRRRAGEPFFTTKEPNKGFGLGLFLARAIAERAGGSLRFEGDQGTTAVLEIPATAPEAAALA